MKIAISFCLMAAISTSALATTGNELLSKCEKFDRPGEWVDSGFCMGFIDGALRAQQSMHTALRAILIAEKVKDSSLRTAA